MPNCGSQVILCDLPVRFDTYQGCGFGCTYCFAARKRRLCDVQPGEGTQALHDWIAGNRAHETTWCDWPLPLHWGGMSDPFQPAELRHRRSLACLRIFADSGYPFVVSTKGTLLARREYRELLARCNAVVQVSLVSRRLARSEPRAPSFAQRLRLLECLSSRVQRVIVRVQPYSPDDRHAVLRSLARYAGAGVHGVTVEGLKSLGAAPGLVKVGGDWCLPLDRLEPDFRLIRARCHELGLRFYAAENRLRRLGDDRCCCGVDGLAGFRTCKANLNALAAGCRLTYTRRMQEVGTAAVFKAMAQNAVSTPALRAMSFRDAMEIARRVPAFRALMGLEAPP